MLSTGGFQSPFTPDHAIGFSTVSGEQIQPVRCFEVDVGVVDETLCDPEIRPEDKHRKCKTMDCPARSLVINVLSVSVTVKNIFLVMRKETNTSIISS